MLIPKNPFVSYLVLQSSQSNVVPPPYFNAGKMPRHKTSCLYVVSLSNTSKIILHSTMQLIGGFFKKLQEGPMKWLKWLILSL